MTQVMNWSSWSVDAMKQKRQLQYTKAVPKSLLFACVSRIFMVHSGWKEKRFCGKVYLVTHAIRYLDYNTCRVLFYAEKLQWATSKEYAQTYQWNIKLAVTQIVGHIRVLIKWWNTEELEVPMKREVGKVGQEGLLSMKQITTVVTKSARQQKTYMVVWHEWFTEYIGRELGNMYECFIEEDCEDCSKMWWNRNGKWILLLTRTKKCRKYHEHDVLDWVIAHSMWNTRTMRLYCSVPYIAWNLF